MGQDRLPHPRRKCPVMSSARDGSDDNKRLPNSSVDDEQLACTRPNGTRSHRPSRPRGPIPRVKRVYHAILLLRSSYSPTSLSLNSSGPSVCPPSPVSASSTKPQPKRPTSPTRSAASRLPQRAPTSSSTSSPSNSTSYTHASSTGRAIHRDTQTRLGRSSADADVARGSPVLTPTARCGSSARRA